MSRRRGQRNRKNSRRGTSEIHLLTSNPSAHLAAESPKVVWVGTGKGAEQLFALQKDLEDLLAHAGYPKEEREFSAHLTLCRVNHPIAGIKMGEAIAQFSHLKLGSIAADALYVYQSQLTPAGPNYTLLGDFKLR